MTTKAIIPFRMTAESITRGTMREAFWTSSDMCAAESDPMKAAAVVMKPMIVAAPALAQLPPLLKEVHTSLEGAFGPRTQRGMQTAKRPIMLKNKITPSSSGSHFAAQTLNAAQNKTVAIVSTHPCLDMH